MIAGSQFTNVFGMVPAGGIGTGTSAEQLTERVAIAAVKAGWSVVLSRPGTKAPMCVLTARAQALADRAAREAAAAAGAANAGRRRHACGIDHALTLDSRPSAVSVIRRVIRENGQVNVGLELAGSRMVVVDVDTAEENRAFLEHWSEVTGSDQTRRQPTVLSPGSRNADGEWVHKDGGHYWFQLPEGITLPVGTGVSKAPGGWVTMWARHQVLVPPSIRPEGPYRLVGICEPAPGWLTDMVIMEAESRTLRVARAADRAFDSDDPIERWSATTTWTDLLVPDGWTYTGLVDTCSCPIWTAPGAHASPKSATAHELGCDKYDTDTGWGPLHIWTDNPPARLVGRRTVTKLTYVALRDHDGSVRGALDALGLGSSPARSEAGLILTESSPVVYVGPPGPIAGTSVVEKPAEIPVEALADDRGVPDDPFDLPGAPGPSEQPDGGNSADGPDDPRPVSPAPDDMDGKRYVRVTRASEITMRATRWLWLDGDAHWLPLGGLTLLGGREGIGKSTIAYGVAAAITQGTLPGSHHGAPACVAVAATEDAWSQTVVPRLVACGADLTRVLRVDTVSPQGFSGALSLPGDLAAMRQVIAEHGVALILLDPLMTVINGKLDTHKDAEVRQALEPLSTLAHECQVGLIGLIHVSKRSDGDLLSRLMASRAFSAVARSVLFAAKDDSPPPEDGLVAADARPVERYLFGQPKNNLAAKVAHTLRYHIEGVRVGHDPDLDQPIWGSRIVWDDQADGRIDDVLSDQESTRRETGQGRTAKRQAADWMRTLLAESPAPRSEVMELGRKEGFSDSALKRAIVDLELVSESIPGGKHNARQLRLPDKSESDE